MNNYLFLASASERRLLARVRGLGVLLPLEVWKTLSLFRSVRLADDPPRFEERAQLLFVGQMSGTPEAGWDEQDDGSQPQILAFRKIPFLHPAPPARSGKRRVVLQFCDADWLSMLAKLISHGFEMLPESDGHACLLIDEPNVRRTFLSGRTVLDETQLRNIVGYDIVLRDRT